MPAGTPTPEHLVAAFRASYLYSGNASASAREVGLEERTGRDLALKLIDDSAFAADRRKLRASALEELVAKRMRVAQVALDRFEGELEAPEPFEGGPPITVIDKRSDYGKLVLEAEKNAHNLAKFDAERSGEIAAPGAVTIHVSPTPEAAERLAEEAAGKKPGG